MPQRPVRSMLPPTMPQGVEVASYRTYMEAQAAVDHLSDSEFDVKSITIVGTDLHMVERVTGRLTMGRAAMSGAGTGALWGGFIGAMMAFGSTAPSPTLWVLIGMGGGALVGIIVHALLYALSGGIRDFTSHSQVVASRYAVLASADVDQAFKLLQNTTGNQMKPRVRSRREEPSGPTEYGSRPDEQPRFGVRIGQENTGNEASSAPGTHSASEPAAVPPQVTQNPEEFGSDSTVTAPQAETREN